MRLAGSEIYCDKLAHKTKNIRRGLSQLQTYVSPEADRAKVKAQGGTNSPGPVYRLDVSFTFAIISFATYLQLWKCSAVERMGPGT